MNERNTNRRAQTPGNRTTQRHQIDGRPAPRRQAATHPIIRRGPSRKLPAVTLSALTHANRRNHHAHTNNKAAGNSHRNEANNAPANGALPAAEPLRLLVEQAARLSTSNIPTRRLRLAKEPAPTFAMDTRRSAAICPFSLAEQRPSLSLFFL